MMNDGNLFTNVPRGAPDEHIAVLLSAAGVRIERIVSHGHASAPDFWYEQDQPEWVILLAGAARLMFDGEEAPRTLTEGDYVHIPARRRHRVDWTDPDQPTVWLAVHYR